MAITNGAPVASIPLRIQTAQSSILIPGKTPPLWVFNSYMHFACVYGKSPVGLPIPAALKKANNPKFDEDFNKRLQELAWKTVTSHPLSGVKAPDAK